MVNWKSKYLEMKLKYINAKNKFKGGMYDTLDEDVDRVAEEAFFDIKVQLINEFLELTWYGYNSGEFGELTETINDFNKKLLCCYKPNYGRIGWSLTSSKIKENPNNLKLFGNIKCELAANMEFSRKKNSMFGRSLAFHSVF